MHSLKQICASMLTCFERVFQKIAVWKGEWGVPASRAKLPHAIGISWKGGKEKGSAESVQRVVPGFRAWPTEMFRQSVFYGTFPPTLFFEPRNNSFDRLCKKGGRASKQNDRCCLRTSSGEIPRPPFVPSLPSFVTPEDQSSCDRQTGNGSGCGV